MAGSQRSVGKFCSVLTNDLTSLSLMDAINLGNGAQVFVISNTRSYRFFAGSGLTTKSPVVIADSGGAGAWIQENAVNDQTFFIEETATGIAGTFTLGVWRALPTANTYAQAAAKACWACSTAGVVTYSGPTAVFQMSANFYGANLLSQQHIWQFDLSRNGVGIGGSLDFTTSQQQGGDSTGGAFCSHLSPPITLVAGDTLQHIMRATDATATFQLQKYQACFQLLPDR